MGEEELGWSPGLRWLLVNEPSLVHEPSLTCPWGKLLPLPSCPHPPAASGCTKNSLIKS